MGFALYSLVLFLILHWTLSARLGCRGLKWILLASVAAFVIVYFGFYDGSFLYAVSTHACLLMLYLHFYVGVDRSVSIRVMHELYEARDQQLSPEALAANYPQKKMFGERVQLMVEHGWIREERGHLFAADRARILVVPTRWLRRLYALTETW